MSPGITQVINCKDHSKFDQFYNLKAVKAFNQATSRGNGQRNVTELIGPESK